ncbi:hypothetical protein [Adhaeretor mobilis]|uniref:Uncharacterized protein n=1 Tax=Adhaeretor mobilis TaxID=1930276 RepID=A0A517N0V7_9BACT|nr:hypothetical protein [Adhaeretor mobilis]QDT00767.1 hypothetical protein HG15A2_41080 [Adhaeretor mobilis]
MASSLLRKEGKQADLEASEFPSGALQKSESLDDETRAAYLLDRGSETYPIRHLYAPAVRLKTLMRVATKESALRKSMAEEIAMKIASRIPGSIHDFMIRFDEKNHYVLEGWCMSYHAKQVAQHEAMLLAGHSQVVNDIVVRRPR